VPTAPHLTTTELRRAGLAGATRSATTGRAAPHIETLLALCSLAPATCGGQAPMETQLRSRARPEGAGLAGQQTRLGRMRGKPSSGKCHVCARGLMSSERRKVAESGGGDREW
jgi:hypothetical protein